MRLATLLADRGDLDGAVQILRTRADVGGDEEAAGLLAEQLADLQGLRAQADAGDGEAAVLLVDRLVDRGDLDGAAQILRTRADAGDWAGHRAARGLLEERGDLDEAAQILRTRADAGDWRPPRGWPVCWWTGATWRGSGSGRCWRRAGRRAAARSAG